MDFVEKQRELAWGCEYRRGDTVPPELRGYLLSDGEMAQLKALRRVYAQDGWSALKMTVGKLAASSSGVWQPCDVAQCFCVMKRYLSRFNDLGKQTSVTEQARHTRTLRKLRA